MTANAVKDSTPAWTISYNGVGFNPLSSVKCPGRMHYNAADITVGWVEYELSVDTVIYAANVAAEDASMARLQALLSTAGAQLIITGIGFGAVNARNGTVADIVNNIPATTPDLMWGVKPRIIEMQPLAGGISWSLSWKCQFCRAFSGVSSTILANAFLDFSYECAYEFDEVGFTTRAISGSVTLPQLVTTPATGEQAAPKFTADWARDHILIQIPTGFQRLNHQWRGNAAKNTLDFTAIDVELKHDPFPRGIQNMDLDFSCAHVGIGTGKMNFELSGTIEVLPGWPKEWAMDRFFQIAVDKLRKIQAAGGTPGANKQNLTIPTGIRIRHKLTRRVTSFSVNFYTVSCLQDILLNGGIWAPLPDSNYAAWAASVTNGPTGKNLWSNRGAAGLAENPKDAIVIDLGIPTGNVTIGRDTVVKQNPPSAGTVTNPLSCGTIQEDNSWLDYEVTIHVKRVENTVKHFIAQAWNIAAEQVVDFSSPGSAAGGIGPQISGSGPGGTPIRSNPVETQGSADNWALVLWRGIRLKYNPVRPTIVSVGGRKATYDSGDFKVMPYADFFGTPATYGGGWAMYRLEDGYVQNVLPKKDITVCSMDTAQTTK